MRTWVEIDTNAACRNAVVMKSLLGGGALTAVVKADGYGHGASQIVRALSGVADSFAVASPSEAEAVLPYAGGAPVMCLYPLVREDAVHAVSIGVGVTVGSVAEAEALMDTAATLDAVAQAHVKVNTGMNRHGATASDAARIVELVRSSPQVELASLWTHLAAGEDPRDPFTHAQVGDLVDLAAELQVPASALHAANSGATLNFGALGLGAGRVGLALYGCYPSDATQRAVELTPALRWHATINRVAPLAAGAGVSYGRRFTAQRDMRIATCCVGYGDGYPHAASGAAEVLIRGRRAKVLGSICMDSMVCDVSHIEGVAPGDIATLIGGHGPAQIKAADVARWSGTIPYEVFTRISARVARVYVD